MTLQFDLLKTPSQAKYTISHWNYMYCAKVDSQRHFQEGHHQRLRDLPREWRCFDGGCRPKWREQAAGGWGRGSSQLKAPGLWLLWGWVQQYVQQNWVIGQRSALKRWSLSNCTNCWINSLCHYNWLGFLSENVEQTLRWLKTVWVISWPTLWIKMVICQLVTVLQMQVTVLLMTRNYLALWLSEKLKFLRIRSEWHDQTNKFRRSNIDGPKTPFSCLRQPLIWKCNFLQCRRY